MDDDQELRDGLTERTLHVERILRRSSYGWIQPRRDQDGVGIRVPHFSSCCLLGVPGSSGLLLFLCCTESEDSIDFRSQRI